MMVFKVLHSWSVVLLAWASCASQIDYTYNSSSGVETVAGAFVDSIAPAFASIGTLCDVVWIGGGREAFMRASEGMTLSMPRFFMAFCTRL